eukprot:CAMPEP_0114607544 /NCGR_PEP_ID=MMETSP0168-20121206/2122_1 /TAXON_ID=95228 ORGANISM="Vannella sp., Strain DIVA3 517/6/12" /NCGR_SAMPLE_ID=MMETSP0168 /ASSEMBLY_ACC=CAM_ASM_000044 /LENGTH=391 /DNA_ID=CAMNT_0001818423 /DNA_START=106 /DNA_END=1278 /DNA_ORIENTATION=+
MASSSEDRASLKDAVEERDFAAFEAASLEELQWRHDDLEDCYVVQAAKLGNFDLAKFILQRLGDFGLQGRGPEGDTLLMRAAMWKSSEWAVELVKMCSDDVLKATSHRGRSLLHYAADRHGSPAYAVIEAVISRIGVGAMGMPEMNGMTPLLSLCRAQPINEDLILRLFAALPAAALEWKEYDFAMDAIRTMANNCTATNEEVVPAYFEKTGSHADFNLLQQVMAVASEEEVFFHLVESQLASERVMSMVDQLQNNLACILVSSCDKSLQKERIMQFLLDSIPASVLFRPDYRGLNIVHKAAAHDKDALLERLLDIAEPATAYATSPYSGHTPLHKAVKHRAVKAAHVLVAALPSEALYIKDRNGRTPRDHALLVDDSPAAMSELLSLFPG